MCIVNSAVHYMLYVLCTAYCALFAMYCLLLTVLCTVCCVLCVVNCVISCNLVPKLQDVLNIRLVCSMYRMFESVLLYKSVQSCVEMLLPNALSQQE